MNTLTVREMFEKANLHFDPLYIKYLLKLTGHKWSENIKIEEMNIDEYVFTCCLEFTESNNILLNIDTDIIFPYCKLDNEKETYNPFNYDNKIILIRSNTTQVNEVASLDNLQKATRKSHLSTIMICEGSTITKNQIENVKNYYRRNFTYSRTKMLLGKNYELKTYWVNDSETEDYTLPTEPIINFYFNWEGVWFNVDNEYIRNVTINESRISDAFNRFAFFEPTTKKELKNFIAKIEENPYLEFA